MGKIGKKLTTFFVIIVNLVLIGVGFLSVKSYQEAGKEEVKDNDDQTEKNFVPTIDADSGVLGAWDEDLADNQTENGVSDDSSIGQSADMAPADQQPAAVEKIKDTPSSTPASNPTVKTPKKSKSSPAQDPEPKTPTPAPAPAPKPAPAPSPAPKPAPAPAPTPTKTS